MSTLSGVSSKGEKGKKFQSLDINSIYHKTNKGESSEQHQTKSTVPRKHGMQSLGKVPSTRRAPVNLPSLKSEHSGSDPTVSLVPTGGTGWGSKASDAPPITSTSPVSTTSGQTPGTNAPAVVGTAPVPQTNITPTAPPLPKPVVSVGGDKTWSSVMVGGEGGSGGVSLSGGSGPSFLAHQSPQFQAEFPSLLGEGGVPGPPPQGGEGGYGPGPSLRPQTEGSWAHGGGYQAPPPTQDTQLRPLTQFPPPVSTPNIVPQYKGVVPSFMLNSRAGTGSSSSTEGGGGGGGGSFGKFPGSIFPSNFQNPPPPIRATNKFHGSAENRFISGGSRPPPMADPEDLMPRPIIREEDLNRMDEISRDTGWATQDDIDYNQKLAFSDDESTGNDDEKDKVKSLSLQSKEEKKDTENEKENREKISINERLTEKCNQPWQGRNTANIPAPDFRNPLARLPHPNTRDMDMDDVWKEKRRQISEQVAVVAEKAKQRKEEEEKRFEETRSKTDNERKKKEDNENEWDKEEKKDLAEAFRQMTQLEPRNYPRPETQSYPRYQNPVLPPRFQKQHNIRQQQQQQQQQQSGSSENRWGNSQHFPSNKQRTRGDNDEAKEKEEDRDKRDRNTPEPGERFRSSSMRSDRGYDNNRKSGYYDNQHDYARSYHRDNDQERDRNKDAESRIRDRENEVEWDNRRMGGSAWDGNRNFEDNKPMNRRDNKKSNEGYNKPHPGLFDDRDNDWRERPENRDRPVRPDSRDSRTSRDSRASREDTRSIQDSVTNDYSWADAEYEKEIHEERPRRKENYKEDRRETQSSRREGYVPGPITKEKMEAYEHKHNMAQVIKQEKKELLSSVSLESKSNEDDSWKKTEMSNNSNNVSWADSADDNSSQQQQQPSPSQSKGASEPPLSVPAPSPADENSSERTSIKEEVVSADKKKDISITSNSNVITNKDKGIGIGRGTGGRSGGGGGRGNWQHYSSNFVYYRGSGSSWGNNKDSSRKGTSKPGKQWAPASDSEVSGDEVSASTESGKEDKKIERKQTPRSPKSGERKKDKDDRNRDPKKSEPSEKSVGGNTNRKSQQQQHLHQNSQQQSNQGLQVQVQTTNLSSQNQQQGGGYDGAGGRKEGFQPRGEPSRRGRGSGSFRVSGGRGPHIGAHYGPPGSKPAFPTPPPTNKEEEAADSSSEEKKRPIITGRKEQRKGDSDSSRSSKTKTGKIKRDQEEWETTSEGSDSEAKGKQQRLPNKKNSQRLNNDKRGPFNSNQINGRPSRLEEGKIDDRLNKEDDDNSHLTNHTDIYHTNNGFQEVRSKKTGKDNRPLSKEELKKNRGKDKGKGPQGGNSKGSQGKSFTREWSNKPPRMQRMAAYLQQQQQQSHQEVSDMNKLNNQNISMFPIRTEVNCPAPAPPPPVNAWDKPITAALRTTPPPANLQHLAPSITNSQDKNVIELNDHGQSGTSSQTSSPSAEKALSKMGREAVEKSLLDGTTPPVQTIIFENTNYKVAPNDMNMKTKYPLKGQRIDKGRVERKLDEELEDGAHLGLGFKPGNEIKPGESKPQEPIQMPMSFSKSEDNADMKLDFAFDSDLTQLTDDKSNIPRSIHQVLGQNSAADLNQKIASVKKVWETPGSMMEHQHHDEVVSTSSSFTPNFGSAVDTSLDHSSVHQVDDTSFTTPDVYAHQNPSTNRTNYFIIAGPQMQGSAPGYASGGANIIKQDPSNATSNVCKVKPQPQQAVISSTIGTHSGGPSLSSPPPPFTQQGHFNYQTQYSNMPAIPSPPAVLINSPAGGQQVPPSHQGELYHSFPIGGPTVIGSQQARSGFSQFPYGLGQSLGGTSAFSQQSLYHLPQPAAPPNPPPDVFQSISQYRIQPSAYGQSQQLSNSPSTVLITSSSNSLMSASVKSSPQPPPIGAIGSKGAYQSSAVPSQVQLGFIPYDATPILPQSFLQNSQLVQRHGANNVVPTIQPPTSYYSGSAGGQTGLFQPGSSILAGGGSQPAALHNAATAFGMQGFSAQSTAPAQPASNNPVGVPYSSQMGHFRGQAPAAYLKAAGGNPVTGQHASDPAKSPSTSQDVINSVFSTGGGGQIPSPKSRNTGNSGAGGKQPQTPQQPSPTQGHHKFASYPAQPNLVMQGGANNNQQQQQLAGRGGVPPVPQGVRTGNNNGNGLGGNAGVARYPTPIQRPATYPGLQPQRHRVPQQSRPPPVSQQQHLQKISSQYYQQQGNPVKLDVEGKSEGDKLQEQTNPGNTKQEKKEETTNSSEQ